MLCLCLSLLPCLSALAGLQIGGTRVLFDGTRQAATISITNKDKVTNLVQSWLSAIDGNSPEKDSFIVTPPLFRLEADGQNAQFELCVLVSHYLKTGNLCSGLI